MIWQTHLTSQFQFNWKTEEQNTTHKPITWWDHIRASAYMPIPGLHAGGVTPELKLRLKYCCSWIWCFYYFFLLFFSVCLFGFGVLIFFLCLFLLLLWVFYFYFYTYYLFKKISILSTLPSSSYPYTHSLHSPPSLVVKSMALLPNNSFCAFSPTLYPCPNLPLPFPLNLSPD
jgi:hypothetical protein